MPPELDSQCSEYAEANDLNLSQVVRKALRLLLEEWS